MSRLRSYAPLLVKRFFWNRKHRNAATDAALAPERLAEFLASCVPPDGAMLDLGCGAGNLCASLRARGWAGYFIGIDISEKLIESATRSTIPKSEWYVSSIEEFQDCAPIRCRKFDVVCLCESIYYVRVDRIPGLVSRCERLLVPKGMIVIRIAHGTRHLEYINILRECGANCNHPLYVICPGAVDGALQHNKDDLSGVVQRIRSANKKPPGIS
jgi:2-polyprenyl-3-methyl-5-hydroxy-6-metoxy-1,4-benzoquinol methylase